jgi:molecular chaperone Hsp33
MLEGDSFQKFMFDDCHIRGEIVRLSDSFQQAIESKQYSTVVRQLLAEATAATLLMTGTLKFEGRLSLHARGQGPLTLLMAEATNTKSFRTIASYTDDLPDEGELRMLLGKAQLAITIDPEKGNRYQGIVPLEHATMAECLARYFDLSEQLETHFMFSSDADGCYGLMLQQLPDYKNIEDQDAWDRIRQLSETLGFDELKEHSNAEILHRLYHEEKVSVYESEPVNFQCSCSEERSLASIEALGREEALTILEEESVIQVDCQFCGQHYEFDRAKINTVFNIGKPH